jgi:hypothetical protein
MTDTQQAEDSFGEVSAMGIQAETIRQLTDDLNQARLALREENVQKAQAQSALRRVQTGLQEGLDEVDDDDERELICDFLNANTQWEFKTTRAYRVTIKCTVLVEAKDEDEAREMADQISFEGEGDLDETEVTDVELDGR